MAWSRIAATMDSFLSGIDSTTVFVDHVFDLRHNGGVLFDKHAMFKETLDYHLPQQLDQKKAAHNVGQLHRVLTAKLSRVDLCCSQAANVARHERLTQAPLSANVAALYQRGCNAGLWAPASPEGAS